MEIGFVVGALSVILILLVVVLNQQRCEINELEAENRKLRAMLSNFEKRVSDRGDEAQV